MKNANSTAQGTATATAIKADAVVSAKVVSEIMEIISATEKVGSATLSAVKVIRSEAKRLGYDEKQTRQMVTLSYRKAKSLPATADEETVKAFDLRHRPDVSKLMGIAFPDEKHTSEVNKAIAHDEAKGTAKHGRIGTSKLLQIARGNLTVADALAGKPASSNRTPQPPTAPDLSATALENALAGIRSRFCKPEAFTPEAIRAIADRVFCDGAYVPSKA